MQDLNSSSLAHLRHDLKTAVNHILGFAEILIEDAAERQIGGFIPELQEIRSGGYRLLEAIESTLPDTATSIQPSELQSLAATLRAEAAPVMDRCTSLRESLEESAQTVSDLEAISVALRTLMEFPAQEHGAVRER